MDALNYEHFVSRGFGEDGLNNTNARTYNDLGRFNASDDARFDTQLAKVKEVIVNSLEKAKTHSVVRDNQAVIEQLDELIASTDDAESIPELDTVIDKGTILYNEHKIDFRWK